MRTPTAIQPSFWHIIAILLPVFLLHTLFTPSLRSAQGFGSDAPVWLTETIPVEVPANLHARTTGGNIEIVSHDLLEIHIEVLLRHQGRFLRAGEEAPIEVSISTEDGRVTIHAEPEPQRWFRSTPRPVASLRIAVPRYTEIRAQTSGGRVSAERISHNVTLITSGGPVRASQITGEVLARTSGGPVTLEGIRGNLTARTSGGPITITDSDGFIQARTSGGGITLRDISGSIEANTSGGNIHASIVRLSEHLSLATSGGSIHVHLPESQGLDLQAHARRIVNDLGAFTGESSPGRLSGTLGPGGVPAELRTSGGSIYLNKRGD